ncbi:hypothetical protein R50072_23820 [Simiduia litorea]|uniref:hypothetical protein n=1 Tax=Simiduia litorea TaxID=1435348 RepID=UPI0036F3C642
MLIGHYSAALAAKSLKPELPLWQLFIAAQLVDIVWALLVFSNIEHMHIDPSLKSNPLDLYYMPFTHSLLATAMWTLVSLLCIWLAFKQRYGHALLLAAVVGSHWFLDFIVHRPDLLLYDDIKVGLALWDTPLLAMTVEFALFTGAAIWLLRTLNRAEAKFLNAFTTLFIAMAVFLVANYFVPMPTDKAMVLISALAIYAILPALAYWLECHRHRKTDGELIAS